MPKLSTTSIEMLHQHMEFSGWPLKLILSDYFKYFFIAAGDSTDSKTSLGDEVTFRVRRSLFGRHGWIVMSTDDSHDLKQLNDVIMHKLSDKIRDMEFSGKEVPNEITIKIKE